MSADPKRTRLTRGKATPVKDTGDENTLINELDPVVPYTQELSRSEELPLLRISEGGKRLIVHSITMENFKSYQGVHVIGPFDQVSEE